jgi:chromosome segregation protein
MIRLEHIEICGFRGIRQHLALDFSTGFTVLTGANGSGKSSILDAIEFAIAGSISKYEDGSGEKGEKSSAYEWWRGSKPATDRYVRLRLVDDTGQTTIITRKPEGVAIETRTPGGVTIENGPEMLDLLCNTTLNPESTLEELCRTSIIRDEFIAKNSVDLPETDRFAFVRSAVGAASTAKVDSKLADLSKLLKMRADEAKRDYERVRSQIQDRVEQLSAAKGHAVQRDTAEGAETRLRQLIKLPNASLEDLIAAADREMRELRSRATVLSSLLSTATILADRRRALETSGAISKSAVLAKQVSELTAAHLASDADLAASTEALQAIQSSEAFISNLALIHQAGSEVGRRSDQCPLCGSNIDETSFRSHLEELRAEVVSHGAQIAAAVDKQRQLRSDEQRIRNELDLARASQDRVQAEIDTIQRQEDSFQAEVLRLSPQHSGLSAEDLRIETETIRDRLSNIEQHRRMLAVSDQTERIVDLERDLEATRLAGSAAEKQLTKARRVEEQIKDAVDTLKRIGAEAVEERLAAIRPLFIELYVRLRPHIDWKNISYAVRGDVRKFLSLRVDDDLNIKFLFSSGQRRATGLAFLISVALSRPWCRFNTLVLDDPIQHVDDFRAVHLVETLAAIRTMHYQLICAVEDPALADLLTRRLRSSYRDGGTLVRMKYVSGDGAQIDEMREIAPFELVILQNAS